LKRELSVKLKESEGTKGSGAKRSKITEDEREQRIRRVCLGFKGGQDGVDVEVNEEEWGEMRLRGIRVSHWK
jgi:hypothetical protein